MAHTHIRLAAANEDVLTGALRTAWKLRIEKNGKTREKRRPLAAGRRSSKQETREAMTLQAVRPYGRPPGNWPD
jgi:hypothetical protein